ncbi:copper homeostasis membrane protein CopD [Novosphingobium subterraneum]|uniref:Copper resistance D n=1 Tax=Novosphingobium subterraneum TaxID=48936 RepID=A0A0B9AH63_9SPHN|nr:copper homeostasis membrane protein CopD [Novosphingobium subterraneum]KHS48636.1 copper resistance D [Novosphingobium subterraneum]
METTGLLAARAAAYLALLLVAGVPLHALAAGQVLAFRARLVLALLAIVAAFASAWWALESVAAMAGITLAELDQATAEVVLAQTPLGKVMEWRLTALAAVFLACFVPLRVLRLPILALAGSVALGSVAWTGHAGASEMALHRVSDVAHVLAAATWIGALAVFVTSALSREGADNAALARFARTGSVVVAVLILTGLLNTLAIAGWPMMFEARWFSILAVKLALFAVMLALAAGNRWRIVPALERGESGATARLRRSLVLEFAAGLGVVGAVALLGVLDPLA